MPAHAVRRFAPLMLVLLTACAATNAAQPPEHHRADDYCLAVTPIVQGLDHPWSLAFLPDGRLLVTERAGSLRQVENGVLNVRPITGVPEVYAAGQGGLLDVAVHPDYAENGWIYLSYAERDRRGNAGTAVVRGKLVNDRLTAVEQLFQVQPKNRGRAHYGGRLAFDRQGYLYLTIGDRYHGMQQAQDPGDHLGSVIRLNDDGTVPPDNPFVDDPSARPEIFSYGHRNPQGLALRPADGALWAHEHGPKGGDEVNILRAGNNYGWPAITYGIDYSGAIISDRTHAPGMEQPRVYWVPSIAPSGMAFYSGDAFPDWQGDLFVGALAGRHLRRLTLDGDDVTEQEVLLDALETRIRDVRTGPDGFLYLLTDNPSPAGAVLQLAPADAAACGS